jgi:hypothetical protein
VMGSLRNSMVLLLYDALRSGANRFFLSPLLLKLGNQLRHHDQTIVGAVTRRHLRVDKM